MLLKGLTTLAFIVHVYYWGSFSPYFQDKRYDEIAERLNKEFEEIDDFQLSIEG